MNSIFLCIFKVISTKSFFLLHDINYLFYTLHNINLCQTLQLTTGDHPEPLWWTCSPRTPMTRGIEGPHMSISRMATCT